MEGVNKILFITQWQYDDALVQTYTLPYINIVKKITNANCYLVTTGKGNNDTKLSERGGINLIELPDPTKGGRLQWFKNLSILNRFVKKEQIPVMHTWCTPAGAIGAILKMRNSGIKLVLDSVEPHAEAMVECKIWPKGGIKFRGLFFLEKLQFKKAEHLIFAATEMDKYVKNKFGLTVSGDVKPACVDLSLFSDKLLKNSELLKKLGLDGKIVCVYAGKFGGFYLEDETFQFVKQCEEFWGKDKFRFLALSNATDEYMNEKMAKFNIQPETVVKLFVPYKEVAQYMGLADFAFSAYKPVPSKRYGTPIKNGEYWALGLPVVIPPNISDDSAIIEKHNAGAILRGFSKEDYMKSISQIDSITKGKTRDEIYKTIRSLAEQYRNFSIAEQVYKSIYG